MGLGGSGTARAVARPPGCHSGRGRGAAAAAAVLADANLPRLSSSIFLEASRRANSLTSVLSGWCVLPEVVLKEAGGTPHGPPCAGIPRVADSEEELGTCAM